MSKSNATRALLGAMILCLPLAAATNSPSITIRVGGAELVAKNHYVVNEGALVSFAVQAAPGGLISLVATSDRLSVTLIHERRDAQGQVYGDFRVPAGLSGMTFLVQAFAIDENGERTESSWITMDVR